MGKKVRNIINVALASLIVTLGFGSCRTTKNVTDNQPGTEHNTDGQQGRTPAPSIDSTKVRPPIVEPPVCVYAPPPVMEQKPIPERPVLLYGVRPTPRKGPTK